MNTNTQQQEETLEKKRKKKRVRRIIYWSIVALLVLALFTLGPIAYAIDPDSRFTQIALDNTINIMSIADYFTANVETVIRAVTALFVAILAIKLIWIITKWLSKGKSNRTRTIITLLYSFTKYIVIVVTLFTILGIFGVAGEALLAGAGIIGLIIAFGMQSLLGDIIAGLFIVFENSFEVGDIITFSGNRGEVLQIGIRTTKIRGIDGNVTVINNSEMRVLINMTQFKSVAVCDVTIGYNENLDKVEKLIQNSLQSIASKLDAITGDIAYKGPAEFNASGIVLRTIAECSEGARLQLTRDLNREIKLLFDKNNIKFAVPNVVVNTATAKK